MGGAQWQDLPDGYSGIRQQIDKTIGIVTQITILGMPWQAGGV